VSPWWSCLASRSLAGRGRPCRKTCAVSRLRRLESVIPSGVRDVVYSIDRRS